MDYFGAVENETIPQVYEFQRIDRFGLDEEAPFFHVKGKCHAADSIFVPMSQAHMQHT